MDWLSDWQLWLVLGFSLLILEVLISGIFLMWWGFAGMVVAGISAITDISFPVQVSIFAVFAIVFSFVWWKYQSAKDKSEDDTTSLNHREHLLIGNTGTIVEILSNGIARGQFGDTTWRVVGENLAVGDKVKVLSVEGITLTVCVI